MYGYLLRPQTADRQMRSFAQSKTKKKTKEDRRKKEKERTCQFLLKNTNLSY